MTNKKQDTALSREGGILLVDKPGGKTSFSLVTALRRHSGIRTIGHAGTLDPFATGVMVLLIGRAFTKTAPTFLLQDKEYRATLRLGIATDSFDCDGQVTSTSPLVPSIAEVEKALESFQGKVAQYPPMFSAKKIQGKKLYELARKGKTVERALIEVTLETTLLSYCYPFMELYIRCSKGTYIRAVAHDLGALLGVGAHLSALIRTRSGPFRLSQCIDGSLLFAPHFSFREHLQP